MDNRHTHTNTYLLVQWDSGKSFAMEICGLHQQMYYSDKTFGEQKVEG